MINFSNKREFELVANEFDRRERAEIDAVLNRAAEPEIRRMLEVDRLERLMATDIASYYRENGSDKLRALLSDEGDGQ